MTTLASAPRFGGGRSHYSLISPPIASYFPAAAFAPRRRPFSGCPATSPKCGGLLKIRSWERWCSMILQGSPCGRHSKCRGRIHAAHMPRSGRVACMRPLHRVLRNCMVAVKLSLSARQALVPRSCPVLRKGNVSSTAAMTPRLPRRRTRRFYRATQGCPRPTGGSSRRRCGAEARRSAAR